jgi:thiol:disulfide interchange protein
MLLRLIILIVICVIMYATYRIVIKWQLSRAGKLKDLDPILSETDVSIPTVVYFTTPMCATCRTTQRPAFDRLRAKIEAINILKVDATEDPDGAKRWGVISVPTTFVLDRDGKPNKVNNGFVDENKLFTQLQTAHGLS